MEWLTPALLGATAGAATGLVPGIHVNTLCALALAIAPASPLTAIGLASAAAAHLSTSQLPATYLGIAGEETLLSALPSHRLTMKGRGPEAVRLGVRSGLTGLLVALLLLLPHKWLLTEPGRFLPWLDRHMTVVLVLLLAVLPARELLRGVRPFLLALTILAFAAAIGLLSTRLTVQALVPVAASALLPLLTGLFGAPALLDGLRAGAVVPEQAPARPGLRLHRGAAATGIASAAFTCLVPGLTSSVAMAVTRWRDDRDGHAYLSAQGAIAGAHLIFSFGLLWVALRPRTGLAVAAATLWPAPAWASGAAPLPVAAMLAGCLAGAALGAGAACVLDRGAARWLPPVARWAALAALVGMVAIVILLSGWTGLLLFAAATAIGSLPARLGIGRLHLTACLLVPVLALRLGFTP